MTAPRIPGVSLRGSNLRTHGASYKPRTVEYGTWLSMRSRVKSGSYLRRGITVCTEWCGSFESFLADVGHRPSPQHSLDRIDNNRGYEPGNVRWATRQEQNRNRSDNRHLEINGVTRCIAEWAEATGLAFSTIKMRLNRGWEPSAAISRRPHKGLRP